MELFLCFQFVCQIKHNITATAPAEEAGEELGRTGSEEWGQNGVMQEPKPRAETSRKPWKSCWNSA